jgi:hypothetical protein
LEEGIPARVDRSYWGERWSGSTGGQLVAALRFLGLIDGNGTPTIRLRQLVSAQNVERSQRLKEIAAESFSFLLNSSLDLETATYSQIEELLHSQYQLTTEVSHKCIKFFIGLANDANIPLSPFVVKKSRMKPVGAGMKRPQKKRIIRTKENSIIPQNENEVLHEMSWDKILLSKFPAFDPSWTDEVKLKWFDAFDILLKRTLAHRRDKITEL